MFNSTSRYRDVPTTEIVLRERNGTERTVRYLRRRFITSTNPLLIQDYVVSDTDRVDSIAATSLGEPAAFWRICDTNRVLNPFDLVAIPGAVISIATISSSTED